MSDLLTQLGSLVKTRGHKLPIKKKEIKKLKDLDWFQNFNDLCPVPHKNYIIVWITGGYFGSVCTTGSKPFKLSLDYFKADLNFIKIPLFQLLSNQSSKSSD